ncbi:MAG: CoA-binding protein [Deltaproteobacteria bacterium]|nr:CoA-binding protein [Deltaproteobacteria bacterium]
MKPQTQDSQIKDILTQSKIIAVVGLSTDPDRPSYEVAAFMQEKGYRIVPVRPGGEEILGQKSYASLKDIPFEIDIVDIFRKPEHIPAVVDEAIAKKAKVVWMQLGLSHEAARKKAEGAGLQVVEDRCLVIEYRKHF